MCCSSGFISSFCGPFTVWFSLSVCIITVTVCSIQTLINGQRAHRKVTAKWERDLFFWLKKKKKRICFPPLFHLPSLSSFPLQVFYVQYSRKTCSRRIWPEAFVRRRLHPTSAATIFRIFVFLYKQLKMLLFTVLCTHPVLPPQKHNAQNHPQSSIAVWDLTPSLIFPQLLSGVIRYL